MKQLFLCANHYLQARDWKTLAGLKFCLCSIGVLLGLSVSGKHKKPASIAAGAVFLPTYIPLMADFLRFAFDFFRRSKDDTAA